MEGYGYNPDNGSTSGTSAAGIGNSIGLEILSYMDSQMEQMRRMTTRTQQVRNPPLYLNTSGTVMNNPSHWQPLAFDNFVTQNEIEIEAFT